MRGSHVDHGTILGTVIVLTWPIYTLLNFLVPPGIRSPNMMRQHSSIALTDDDKTGDLRWVLRIPFANETVSDVYLKFVSSSRSYLFDRHLLNSALRMHDKHSNHLLRNLRFKPSHLQIVLRLEQPLMLQPLPENHNHLAVVDT